MYIEFLSTQRFMVIDNFIIEHHQMSIVYYSFYENLLLRMCRLRLTKNFKDILRT